MKLDIKSAQYVNTPSGAKYIRIFLNGQDNIQFDVPPDPENGEYTEILKQVKEGTLTIKDAD